MSLADRPWTPPLFERTSKISEKDLTYVLPRPETPEEGSPYMADYSNGTEAMREQEKHLLAGSLSSDTEKDSDTSETPFLGGIKPRKFRIIFAAILTANFIAGFDSTIMATTHATITSSFNSSELASWLSTSFLLTAVSFQPLFGRISDVMGRKIPIVFGCTVFTAATVGCALAPSIESFLVARAICGLGAAGMITMGAIILSDMIPIRVRGMYQSINNLAWGAGCALGAAIGGYLADTLGWRWEFGVQVPVGLLCVLVLAVAVPHHPNPEKFQTERSLSDRFRDFDFAGSALLSTTICLLVLAVSLGGNILPWTHPLVLTSLTTSIALAAVFILVERRVKHPVMPLSLLTTPPRANHILSNILLNIAHNAIIFNIPLYLQTVLLQSATTAGTHLLIPAIFGTTAGVLTGLIINHTGRCSPTLYVGVSSIFLGALALCFITPAFPDALIFVLVSLSDIGLCMTFPSSLMSVLAARAQEEQAVVTSCLMMWRTMGSVLGVAVGQAVVQNLLQWGLRGVGEEVARAVRGRVSAVAELEGEVGEEVRAAYEVAVRGAFVLAAVCAGVGVWCVVGVGGADLRKRRSEEGEEGQSEGEMQVDEERRRD